MRITSLMVLRDAMIQGKMHDDRPPASQPFMQRANEDAAFIVDAYPEPKPPYTAKIL